MADCSTQGDPDQIAPQGNHGDNQNNPTMPIQHTNNYLIPDGSDRHIHDMQDKTFHRSILENGHNAYLAELPNLKSLLAAPPPATVKAKPHQTPQSKESLPGSSIPFGQGTPTATSSQPPGDQMIALPARLMRLQCPTLQKKRY